MMMLVPTVVPLLKRRSGAFRRYHCQSASPCSRRRLRSGSLATARHSTPTKACTAPALAVDRASVIVPALSLSGEAVRDLYQRGIRAVCESNQCIADATWRADV